jgi:hypothetical protein
MEQGKRNGEGLPTGLCGHANFAHASDAGEQR